MSTTLFGYFTPSVLEISKIKKLWSLQFHNLNNHNFGIIYMFLRVSLFLRFKSQNFLNGTLYHFVCEKPADGKYEATECSCIETIIEVILLFLIYVSIYSKIMCLLFV